MKVACNEDFAIVICVIVGYSIFMTHNKSACVPNKYMCVITKKTIKWQNHCNGGGVGEAFPAPSPLDEILDTFLWTLNVTTTRK